MAKYLFRMDKMHVNAKRNLVKNEEDWDVITFGVEVGAQQYGPLKDYGAPPVDTGADLDFSKYPYLRMNSNQVELGKWEIGPIDVAETDIASVGYSIVNAEHTLSGGGNTQTTIAVSAAAWAAIVGIGAGAGGPAGAIVTAIAAGIAAVAGLLLKDVPNCDGVVGGNKISFTGVELRQGTSNPQQMLSFSDRSGNPSAPDGCGASDIVMTLSVTAFPSYSMKNFLISKFNLNENTTRWTAGFRAYTKAALAQFYSGPRTSVRYVIENWELVIIS
jgi:hypothetical protein